MSTRSLIGHYIDGGVRGIYCHYDGYPEHVGKILVQHHNSLEACETLTINGHIRSFDHDGTVALFNEGDYEEYSDVQEVLESGFNYVYVYEDGWKCFGRKDGVVKQYDIPSEEPAAEPEPEHGLDLAISKFVKRSDAKFNTYAHAAGYLTGVLLRVENEISATTRNELIRELNDWVKENAE